MVSLTFIYSYVVFLITTLPFLDWELYGDMAELIMAPFGFIFTFFIVFIPDAVMGSHILELILIRFMCRIAGIFLVFYLVSIIYNFYYIKLKNYKRAKSFFITLVLTVMFMDMIFYIQENLLQVFHPTQSIVNRIKELNTDFY